MNAQRTHPLLHRRTLLAAATTGTLVRPAAAQAPSHEDPWPSLATQIFDGRVVQDGGAVVAIDAPNRAEDAALVPIGIRSLLPIGDPRHVRGITLVIDENPSPLAAVFSPGAGSGMRSLSTRVRVQFLHQPACRSETERRATLRGAAVRQGGRRLLGSRREADGGRRPPRHHALPAVSPCVRCG